MFDTRTVPAKDAVMVVWRVNHGLRLQQPEALVGRGGRPVSPMGGVKRMSTTPLREHTSNQPPKSRLRTIVRTITKVGVAIGIIVGLAGVWIVFGELRNSLKMLEMAAKQTALAAEQLEQGNRIAKTAYALEFVRDLENRDFQLVYRRAFAWLSKNQAGDWPDDEQLAADIKHVMDRFASLATFYDENVLDRQVIETTIGWEVPRFYMAVKPLLKKHEIPGYEILVKFSANMESCLAFRRQKLVVSTPKREE
jgi:hypothetical protein